MEGTAVAKLLSWQIQTAEIVGATTIQSHATTVRELCIDKTFQVPAFATAGPTVGIESYALPAGDRPEEAIVSEIRAYSNLQDGWDGEFASKPDHRSIESASNFVRLLGGSAMIFEPTLHSDGSIILETEQGAALRFLNPMQISVVLPGYAGIVDFDGMNIPPAILHALEV